MNLKERIKDLSPAQRKRLIEELKKRNIDVSDLEAAGEYRSIEPVEEREYYPLSPSQKRFYILNHFTEYQVPTTMIAGGPLDRRRFENAFRQLIQRHESLRTSFFQVEGEPFQRIHKQVPFEVGYYDFAHLTADERAAAGEGREDSPLGPILARFFERFDLTRAPLMRVVLIKLGKDKHLVLHNMHHLISDGASKRILSHEFSRLYEEQTLPQLTVRYRDFSVWREHQFNSGEYRGHRDYWRTQFPENEPLPVLDLPTDYPRPPMQSFEGRRIPFQIQGETFEEFKKLTLRENVSLYMGLLSLYNILLYRYSGQEDIIIGTVSAGRLRPGVQPVIGIFINPLAMRNQPAGQKTFREFLRGLKQNTLEAYEHQAFPFGDLLDMAIKRKDLSRNPLFDTMIILHNLFIDVGRPRVGDAEFLPYVPEFQAPGHAQQDLALLAVENRDSIDVELEYCTALFKPETIRRMAEHFLNLLTDAAAHPDRPLSRLEMISPREKELVLETFNSARTDYPPDLTLHQWFEQQVEKTPDNIAVIYHDSETGDNPNEITLTYSQLNRRADELAHYLIQRGVQPDSIVGLIVEPSVELFIGLSGILKSGGAYMPISPDSPQERIDYIMTDSHAKLKLTRDDIIQSQPATRNSQPATNHFQPATSLCYVIYTSGSTGRPKGVLVEHRNVVAYLHSFFTQFSISADDTVIQLASYTFDVFTEEIYPVLLRGGKIVIPNVSRRMDIDYLVRLIREYRVSIIDSTPLLLNEFNQWQRSHPGDGSLSSLHTVISGGDVLKPEHVDELVKTGNVYNTYGPTESTVCITYHRHTGVGEGTIPIGKPIANYNVLILDKNNVPQPVGLPGELCVSGPGVTRGYLNRPDLTAETFLSNSKFKIQNSKLYKTGDLARWLEDGSIDFLGRIDRQVKIRGFRIELGEIESRLIAYPGIRETVVVDRLNKYQQKYLCAYYVPGQDTGPLMTEELREHLSTRLPDYMAPDYFVKISSIPLTPNGKIDIHALPEPKLMVGEDYIAPRNEAEKKLVDLCAEVLNRDTGTIGTGDNFFQLGGQSILAMKLISNIRDEFNVTIPLARFFQVGTVSALAELITEEAVVEETGQSIDNSSLLRPFQLDKPPLLRASLVKLPDQRHLFFVAMHHIITDDFSIDLIRREFFQLYSASPQTDPLPPQTLQYKDFSHWQEQFFKSERFREHEKYWLEIYKEPVPRFELPLDFPRPDKPGTEGKTIQFPVPSRLEAQIRQLTAQQEATLFMFFSAAYSLLLSKLCRQEDIVVGVPASGRTHADSTGILGFFVNTLALRFRVNAGMPFYRYLDAVKRHIMGSLENQDYPFQFLVEKLNLSGDYGRNPLFDTMFTLANFDEEEIRSGDETLKVSPFHYDTGRVMFDLVMGVLVTPKAIRLNFIFNSTLFKDETINEFARQFLELLENITAAPESAIGSVIHNNLPTGAVEPDVGQPLAQNYNIDPRQEAYWLKQFENPVPVLALPTDYRKSAIQDSGVGTLDFHIPRHTQHKLLEIAPGENIKLFNLLLAVLNAWLHRLTGQDDIIIGTTVQGSENINNTLALRNRPMDGKTFLFFLSEVSANTSAAFDNRDYPFEYLVKELDLSKNSGGNPLFDVMLQLYKDKEEAHELNDELNDELNSELNNTQCDITLNAVEAKEEIRFSLTYRTGLFTEETIRRYTGYFTTAVVSLMENPEIDLRDIHILPSREKAELLYDFNNFVHPYPADKTVMQLFEEQAGRTPEKTAVVSASESLTFRQLNEESNRLARVLRQRGIKPNAVVGLMMERSPRFLITLYAILKAGGAYLPIDPSYPEQRITSMLEASKAAILITDDGNPESGNIKYAAPQLLDHGEIQSLLPGMSPGNLEPVNQPDHMIYIIFTSGSTGVPKGAGVYHRGFVNLMNWFIRDYRLDETDSNVLMTSSSFDLTQKNFYTSPLCGGVLHIPTVNYFDILEMVKIIEENHVTWINCTPSMFLQLIEYCGGDRFRQLQSLRYVYLGGEPLPVGMYMDWLQSENCHAKIVNTYGPTECTDISNAYVIEEPGRFIDTAVPIGKPIYNVQLYVLDHHFRLQPIGFPGELCIGGDSIGLGYINDKQLTREKFINIKLPKQENGSLAPGAECTVPVYRTGDLVKWLPDGTIEFIGRLDNQVKIRGLRIELGEIENILLAHPQVNEAAAVVRQDEGGNKYLAAYIVPNGDMNTVDIQEHLSRQLPDYMVPSTYIKLDKMPLTPSGKLDRRALPETGMNLKQGAPYVKPRTPQEQQLARLWSETLNIHPIGIDDNFFQLGGDSLRAYLLLAKINRQFQIQAVLNHLFAAPTVRCFAESLSLSTGEGIPGISPVEEREYYPASPAQERLYVLNRLDSGDTGYNVYMSMLIEGEPRREQLSCAVEQLVKRHEALRTGFEMHKGGVVQRVHENLSLKLQFLEINKNANHEFDNIDNHFIQNVINGSIPLKEHSTETPVKKQESSKLLSGVKLRKMERKRKEL